MGNSKVCPAREENTMALASSTELMPSWAGSDERLPVQNGVDEILHDSGVRQRGVVEWDFHVPDFRLDESGLGGSAELDHVGVVAA